MSKFTPVFAKDGDTYIVPAADFIQDTAELADVAGIAAGLTVEYGLSYTGRTEELGDDGKYQGPYVTATIRDKQAQIISGQSLVSAVENGSAENAPSKVVIGVDLASGPDVTAILPADFGTKENPKTGLQVNQENTAPVKATLTGGDHTGPDVVDAL